MGKTRWTELRWGGLTMSRLLLAVLAAILAAVLLAGALPGRAQSQSMTPSALPDGPARDLVEGTCTACHPASQITRSSGFTREGWAELTGTMVDLSGNSDLKEDITGYLATHFPPNQDRAATLVPGNR